ncbi:methyltransferase family protein [Thalassotalea sp. PLHSN55]|uniref:methyltransferase family protein n=1 Tax=Thalassotalea sp. PLHSN55 TaxID=3435888 RepID=UPI003F865ED9
MNLELKVIPVVQLAIAMFIAFALKYCFAQFNYQVASTAILALTLFALALLIGVKAVLDFRRNKTTVNPTTPEKTSAVVDSGIFAYSRNPMYLAMLLALISVTLWLQNLLCFVVIPLFFWYIVKFQIIPEERALKHQFKQNYIDYQQKVRRWL